MAFLELLTKGPGPISVETAKAHGKIRTDKEDQLIQIYLDGVFNYVEDFTGLDIRPKTYKQTGSQLGNCLILHAGQVQSVTGLSYLSNGVNVEIPEAEYNLYKRIYQSSLGPVSNGGFRVQFPLTDGGANGYTALFTTDWPDLPSQMIIAMLNHFMFFYENRGDAIAAGASAGSGLITLPPESERVYKQYRVTRI